VCVGCCMFRVLVCIFVFLVFARNWFRLCIYFTKFFNKVIRFISVVTYLTIASFTWMYIYVSYNYIFICIICPHWKLHSFLTSNRPTRQKIVIYAESCSSGRTTFKRIRNCENDIWGSSLAEYVHRSLVRYDAVLISRWVPTFRINILPLSSKRGDRYNIGYILSYIIFKKGEKAGEAETFYLRWEDIFLLGN
jgi:hypothetical protein